MMHDQGPKDGDFARYVESLGQRNPLAASHSAEQKDSMPVSPDEPYPVGNSAAHTLDQARESPAELAVSPESKSAVAEIVRAVLLALLALFILAPLVPEPFDALVRVAAIFYVVYIVRRNQPVLAQLRSKLAELGKQQH